MSFDRAPQVGLPARHEWMVVVRVYGSILYATRRWGAAEGESVVPLEPRHIEEWMSACAEAGVTTVLWRANCAGSLTYPSQWAPLPGETPLPAKYQLGDRVIEQGWPEADWVFLGEQCRRFDTLRAGVEAAHRHGLRFLLDFSTFDLLGQWCTTDAWPEGGTRAWDPDLYLCSREGKERLAGVPCYAEPTVKARRLAEIEEALGYDIDGIHLGFFSHCDAHSGSQPNRFGFNPVIVDEFRERFGHPPANAPQDTHRLYALHGEHFTRFVRDASRLVRGRGKTMLCAARTDGVHGWTDPEHGGAMNGVMPRGDRRDGRSHLPFAAGFYVEWEKWCDEGLVDGLVTYAPYPDGVEEARGMQARSGKPVYLMRKFTGYEGRVSPPQTWEGMRAEAERIAAGDLGGWALHLMFLPPHRVAQPDWRELLPHASRVVRGPRSVEEEPVSS
jgi:hypothetical protein